MARKISAKGCRQKGLAAENELVDILTALGLPSTRVLGSGRFSQAKSDVRFGVDDVTAPADEQTSIGRLEVKNRKDNPDHLIDLIVSEKQARELAFQHQEQDNVAVGVAYRRSRIKPGDMKNENWDNMWIVSFPKIS